MTIDVDENLSKTAQDIKRQIVLKETKEKTRIENPKLYDFVYNDDSITIPPHLNFAQIPSFIENVQYTTLQSVKHCFEQDKMQLQNIPWKEVPIPPPQMNVKIIGENRNQQRKARQKEAKRLMQMGKQCNEEGCKDEHCERESSVCVPNMCENIQMYTHACTKAYTFRHVGLCWQWMLRSPAPNGLSTPQMQL